MDSIQLLLEVHARNHSSAAAKPAQGSNQQDGVLDGMTDAQKRKIHLPGLNSIAWIVWHMARSEDQGIHIAGGRKQVFEEGDWAAKLKIADRNTGSGHSQDDVARVSAGIDLAALVAYRNAVGLRTREILKTLKPADLEAVPDMAAVKRAASVGAFGEKPDMANIEKNWSTRTKGYCISMYGITHNVGHWGEATTIKGFVTK